MIDLRSKNLSCETFPGTLQLLPCPAILVRESPGGEAAHNVQQGADHRVSLDILLAVLIVLLGAVT
eukprot:7249626-Pyramimonas_sp.AAC.1